MCHYLCVLRWLMRPITMTNPSHLCDVLLFMCIYEFRDTIKTNNNNIKKGKNISFLIVLIPYINLLNLSWIINCLILRNMAPLRIFKGNCCVMKMYHESVCCVYSLEPPLRGDSNMYIAHIIIL